MRPWRHTLSGRWGCHGSGRLRRQGNRTRRRIRAARKGPARHADRPRRGREDLSRPAAGPHPRIRVPRRRPRRGAVGGPRRPRLLAETLADAIGARRRPGTPALRALVDEFLPRRTLLVLDTCDRVVGAAGILVGLLLRSVEGLRVLTTSRQRLGLPGEHLYPVGGLPDADAVRLITALAGDRLGGTDPAELCTRLDNLPLAIRLAVADGASGGPGTSGGDTLDGLAAALDGRLISTAGLAAFDGHVTSPDELATALEGRTIPAAEREIHAERTGAAQRGRAVAPRRHSSMRVALGWSHELCTPQERLLGAGLGLRRHLRHRGRRGGLRGRRPRRQGRPRRAARPARQVRPRPRGGRGRGPLPPAQHRPRVRRGLAGAARRDRRDPAPPPRPLPRAVRPRRDELAGPPAGVVPQAGPRMRQHARRHRILLLPAGNTARASTWSATCGSCGRAAACRHPATTSSSAASTSTTPPAPSGSRPSGCTPGSRSSAATSNAPGASSPMRGRGRRRLRHGLRQPVPGPPGRRQGRRGRGPAAHQARPGAPPLHRQRLPRLPAHLHRGRHRHDARRPPRPGRLRPARGTRARASPAATTGPSSASTSSWPRPSTPSATPPPPSSPPAAPCAGPACSATASPSWRRWRCSS